MKVLCHSHISIGQKDKLSRADWEVIERYNEWDMALYNAALVKFQAQVFLA